MRIVAWNILAGGGDRLPAITRTIEHLAPQVVVLSEFRVGAVGDALRKNLTDLGLAHQLTAPAAAPRQNSVLLASAEPMGASALGVPEALRGHVACARVGALDLLGAFCARPTVASEFVTFMASIAPAAGDGLHALALGDFYHGPRGFDANGGLLLRPALVAGWTDLWKQFHGDEVFWSFRSTRGKSAPDHAWSSNSVAQLVSSVRFSDAELEAKLSDHAPMILEASDQLIVETT